MSNTTTTNNSNITNQDNSSISGNSSNNSGSTSANDNINSVSNNNNSTNPNTSNNNNDNSIITNNSNTNNDDNDGNQIVCVKRSESSLATVFEDMYLNERLVDITLSCSDGQLQAHKLVLAACSPYFSGLFDRLANPFHYPVVVIKDMLIEDLKLMVEFMYKGQLTLSRDKLMEIVKNAENLQITGLSDLNPNNISPSMLNEGEGGTAAIVTVEAPKISHQPSTKSKRARRTVSSLLNYNQVGFERTFHHTRLLTHSDPSPDKLLEQSMITGESLDSGGNQQFMYAAASSSKNINQAQHLQHIPTTSLHIQQSMGMDAQLQQGHHHQISNQLQVLSHSLTSTNRTSAHNGQSSDSSLSSQHQQQQHQQQPHRGRVHPCNICWKTFRERANLKRHLQVHSLDRVMYACLDCNKTFSWKDNYIRHTKTAHHMNNARQQAS